MFKRFNKFTLATFLSLLMGILLLSCAPEKLENGKSLPTFVKLAVSWQPAFCEQNLDKPECATLTPSRYDATHFSFHGLWPQPVYCNISNSVMALDKNGQWDKLPDLKLNPILKRKLDRVMPGTQSFLQRHEWVKHGSCYKNGSARIYFSDSVQMMNELNRSLVNQLFADNLGKFLKASTIRSAFDKAFGAGAGKRIEVQCKRVGKRKLIEEIIIHLYGNFNESISLPQLILAAKPTSQGCKGGVVDTVRVKYSQLDLPKNS